MNTQTLILILVVLVLAVVGVLIWLAYAGYGFALVLLGAAAATVLIGVGLSFLKIVEVSMPSFSISGYIHSEPVPTTVNKPVLTPIFASKVAELLPLPPLSM